MINVKVEVESKLICFEIEYFSINVKEKLRKIKYFKKLRI